MAVKSRSVIFALVSLVLWAAAVYFLLIPLLAPRGVYFWGAYRLVDIFAGLPIFFAAVVATVSLSGKKEALFRLASIGVSTLLTVAVIDVVCAIGFGGLLRPAQPSDFWFDGTSISREDNIPDAELGFARKPGIDWRGRLSADEPEISYRTDELGFRNPPGMSAADLVFIGDSFTEAATVAESETFVRLIEGQTGQAAVNLGIGHYGPQQELTTLERHGFSFNPKTVVWQVFEGNDVSDARRFADWRTKPIKDRSWAQRYASASLIVSLLERTKPKEDRQINRMRLSNGEIGTVHLDYEYVTDQARMEPLGFSETTNAIAEAQRLSKQRGIRFIVLFVPIKVRVLGQYVDWPNDIVKKRFLPSGEIDVENDLSKAIADFCRREEIEFVDATSALQRSAASDNRSVFKTAVDSHLDTDGHRAIADLIVKQLGVHEPPR